MKLRNPSAPRKRQLGFFCLPGGMGALGPAAGGGGEGPPGYVLFQASNQGEDASTTFVDDTGNYTLTAIGNAQLDTSEFIFGDSSALFDGAGDGVNLNEQITLTHLTKWALEIWFRPRVASYTDATATFRGLTLRSNSGGNDSVEEAYWYDAGGGNHRIFGMTSGNKDVMVRLETNFAAGSWYYLLIQNDPTAGTMKSYIGTLGGSLTEMDSRTNKGLRFQTYGYSVAASTDYHDGSIGPLRITQDFDVPLAVPDDLFEGYTPPGGGGGGPVTHKTFAFIGSVEQEWTVETTGVHTCYMWGAGGGSNFNQSGGDMALGGAGGFLKFDISLTAGDVVTTKVAGGGKRGAPGSRCPGSGGGRTELRVNGTLVAIAGGGGGGGGYGNTNTQSWGGEGGGTSGLAGQGGATNSGGATPGLGGTSSAGGAGGTPGPGATGASTQGGNGSGTNLNTAGGYPNGGAASTDAERGGGGGDGYFGGGGGGGTGTWGNGGGGGSSYTSGACSNVTHTRGVKNAAPATAEPGYSAGVAAGGSGGTNGGNGRVHIDWT